MIDELCAAAANNDIDRMTALVTENNVDINAYHTRELAPPIVFATRTGHLEAVKRLVDLGANIRYYEQDGTQPPILFWALLSGSDKMIVYLIDNFNLDINVHIRKSHYSLPQLSPFLREIVLRERWDLFSSLMKENLRKVDIELLYTPLNDGDSTALNKITYADYNQSMLKTLITYLFVHCILKSTPSTFNHLERALLRFTKKLMKVAEYKNIIKTISQEKINLFAELNNILTLLFSKSTQSSFHSIPLELRLIIAKNIACMYLPEISENNITQLVTIFSKYLENTFYKTAQLAFFGWREKNSFFPNNPTKEAIVSKYQEIEGCLGHLTEIPKALRQGIVDNITQLPPSQLNKSGFRLAIKEARMREYTLPLKKRRPN